MLRRLLANTLQHGQVLLGEPRDNAEPFHLRLEPELAHLTQLREPLLEYPYVLAPYELEQFGQLLGRVERIVGRRLPDRGKPLLRGLYLRVYALQRSLVHGREPFYLGRYLLDAPPPLSGEV